MPEKRRIYVLADRSRMPMTPLTSVYVHELLALAKAVRDNCDTIFAETPVPERGYTIKISPELHARINAVLIDAANIRKLIQTSQERRKNESKRRWRFRLQRARTLTDLLRALELDEILDARVRNSIEHFADDLDEACLRLSSGPPPAPMAAYNMVISHWGATQPRVYPLRLYVAVERKYYNFKYVIDLGRLQQQAAAILDRLLNSGVFGGIQEVGGLMIRLEGGERERA